eukprot:XP_001692990.1 predicted protein [Chlamydomonas reinhardtii]
MYLPLLLLCAWCAYGHVTAYRELLDDMLGEGVAVDRACLRSSLPALAASCDATFNSTDSSRLRVVMSSLIHACTRFDDDGGSVRRLRVIAGVARLYPELQRLSTQFSAATGIPIYFNFSTRIGSSGALIRSAMARPPPVVDSGDNTAGGADAFITTTSLLPNLDQGGKLLDVNGLVGDDGQLRWYEINKALREQMAVYGNKVVGIPVTTSPVFLFYHKPVFARDNLTVPVTWEQVLALAERYNGTDLNGNGVPGYGMCMTPPDCFVDGTILQWILGSFVQTQGYSQGLILDPETLADLANSSAMAEALTIMKRLRRVGPLSGNCAVFEDEAYLEGRCLLSITTPTTFKAAYSPEKPARFAAMRGRMGMAPFPGSTRVLDRASGNLTDCDAARCRMARVKARDASGIKRPVNQPTPSSSIVVLINAQTPVKYQFYAYSLTAALTCVRMCVSRGGAETVPFRDTDLTPDAAASWVARGYDPSDVDQFLSTLRTALSNPNQNFEAKFPGNVNISARCTAAAVVYTNATPGYVAPPLPVVLGMIGAAVDAVVEEQGGAAVFGPLYRSLLNWGRSQYSTGDDIQSSTGLWEHLDAGVMDRALSTHHAVMRKAIADWSGYESATEGDSFIVAFRSATDALMCALAAQQALLDAAWPEELLSAEPGLVPGLEAPDVDPLAQVGAVPVTASSKQTARSGRLGLTQRAPTLAGRSRNGSNRSWGLFGGPAQASYTPPPTAWLAGSGGGALGSVALPVLHAHRRAQSGSGHGASPNLHASEADEARTYEEGATEDTEPHATVPAAASEGDEEGTDGAGGPSSSGPLNAPAVPATAPLGAVVHSTAGGTGGLGSGLLKAFSNITAAVGGNSSGLLWRLASAGPSARVGPPGAVGGAQGWVRHQIHASCSQPAATGRMLQWWGHRLTNESGGGGSEQVHAYQSLAVMLSRVRTLTGGGRHSNDGSTPGTGTAATAAEGAAPAAAAVVLFRGLRVRMGIHTGVAAAAEVTVNAISGRTQYSGDCITWAKHVSDTVHGGMVVFGEATRLRLDVDAVRAARPYLLYSGLHLVGREGIEHGAQQRLHLYVAYGTALLPRALVVRPLNTAAELRPGVLAAPVGHGTVVQVRVVGAERLLSWNYAIAAKAMQVLQDLAMQLLSGPDDGSQDRSTGGSGPGGCSSWVNGAAYVLSGGISLAATGQTSAAAGPAGGALVGGGGGGKEAAAGGGGCTGCGNTAGVLTLVFPDSDSAVSWAAALRGRLSTLEWPPELLGHELCEEVWAPAPSGAGFGDGYRFVPRQPLRHAMTANLPLTGGAGAPPSPVVHGGSRPRFGSAMSGPGRPGGGGAAPGSPRGVVPPRTSDVAAGAAGSGAAARRNAGDSLDEQAARQTLAGPSSQSWGPEVPALTSSNEIEVHTSPVGWASAQPQPQRSSTHSGPSTAGIWASSAGPAAVAAMPATETPEQLAAAAAAADAGDGGSVGAGSGEDLVPLRLLYRGLRMRAAVSCGPLKGGMVAGDVSGHVSYRGKAFAQLAKLMAKAKTGQIVATADLARTLPPSLSEELTLIDKL